MRRWRIAVLLAGTLLGHAAQAQSAGAVRGKVVDQDGRPVENAQLVLTPGSQRATSLEDGRFAIAGVRIGLYALSVHRIGYEAAEITVAVTDSMAPLTVTLVAIPTELAAIRIREKAEGIQYSAVVLDQYDVPVEGAEVVAMGINDHLTTDGLGRFTVPRLAKGTLMLRIRKMGYAVHFDSFRMLAERADTIRMERLAGSLAPVEINERSGFGADEWAYKDLDQRTRWKSPMAGSISREELSQHGGANLCDVMHGVGDASRFGLITQFDCPKKFFRVLVDGATCETRKLTDFMADQLELVEYYPKPQNSHILFTNSDNSGNLERRGCPPEVVVVWTKHEVATALPKTVAATAPPKTVAASAPALPSKPAYLQGQVVDSLGRPVRAAIVYTDEPPRATLSDKKGYFRLPELAAGPTTIRVQRDGFVGTEFQLRLPPDSTVGIGVRLLPAAPAFGNARVDTSAGVAGRTVRVVSADGAPIVFANVSIDGARPRLTDDKGEVDLDAGKRQAFTVRVLRIGYAPWFAKVDLPPAALVTVTLPRIALAPVVVTGEASAKAPLDRVGFYDRWMMRQKGSLSAEFIGPEELAFRHPDRVTTVLRGLNGVCINQMVNATGKASASKNLYAFSPVGGCTCPMAVVVDGLQQYPAPAIDDILDVNDVAAIEVYARGGNTPSSMQVNDTKCGVIALWTGSRR